MAYTNQNPHPNMTAYSAPGHSNNHDTLLNAAAVLTSLPFLAVILTISLPIWLPMAIYRRVRGSHSKESQ